MDAKIVRRIEDQLGMPGVLSALTELPPSDLQTLLLELNRMRAEDKQPATVLSEWERNRFVRPSLHSPGAFLAAERAFLAALAEGTEALTLSPVAPLGACASVATVSQHKIVSAERGTEVLADPTNVLALECATRRRSLLRVDPRSKQPISLAAVHRVVRAQAMHRPEHTPHFGITSLCTAGRDEGSFRFELNALREHLATLARWVRDLDANAPLDLRITLLDGGPSEERVRDDVMQTLSDRFAHVNTAFDPDRESGRGY